MESIVADSNGGQSKGWIERNWIGEKRTGAKRLEWMVPHSVGTNRPEPERTGRKGGQCIAKDRTAANWQE